MRITPLLIFLLPLAAQASGTLMIQPQPDRSIRFIAEGPTGSGGEDVLGFQLPASSTMMLNVSSSGLSRCENGDLVLGNLRFSFTNLLDNSKVLCGMPLTFDAQGKDREVNLRVAVRQLNRPATMEMGRLRQALLPAGSVSAVNASGKNQQYPIYLDLSAVQQSIDVLVASFSQTSLSLGEVGDLNDVTADVELRVSKSTQAGNASIGYTLSFESAQQLNNQYRMQAPGIEQKVPYQILIGGQEVLPDSSRRGSVPAGTGTSDVVGIQFKILGKHTRGMAAGILLQDTLTAVITPDS